MDQDLYSDQISTISEMMKETPETSPEHRLAMATQSAFSALDEIMAIGADPETKHLLIRDRIAMAQLQSRMQLINSFILVSGKPGQLKVVQNG